MKTSAELLRVLRDFVRKAPRFVCCGQTVIGGVCGQAKAIKPREPASTNPGLLGFFPCRDAGLSRPSREQR